MSSFLAVTLASLAHPTPFGSLRSVKKRSTRGLAKLWIATGENDTLTEYTVSRYQPPTARWSPSAEPIDIRGQGTLDCNSVAMKPPADRPWWVRAALPILVALVVLGVELPELHNHDAGTPGLYSEDCLLARLAVPSWGLPAVAPPALPEPEALPDSGPPPTVASPSAEARWASAPRAPPATA